MHTVILKIICKWGIIAAIVNGVAHAVSNYIVTDNQILKNGLEIGSLLFSFFCIYKAVKEYRSACDKREPFLFLQGLKAGIGTVLVFCTLFLIYSAILYNFADTDFLDNYKAKQSEFVRNSERTSQEKEKSLQMIDELTLSSFVLTNFIRSAVFPVMAALFIAASMQRKYVVEEEPAENELTNL